jgi:hypothetical protein
MSSLVARLGSQGVRFRTAPRSSNPKALKSLGYRSTQALESSTKKAVHQPASLASIYTFSHHGHRYTIMRSSCTSSGYILSTKIAPHDDRTSHKRRRELVACTRPVQSPNQPL